MDDTVCSFFSFLNTLSCASPHDHSSSLCMRMVIGRITSDSFGTHRGGLACYLSNSLSPDTQLLVPICVTTPDIELLVLKISCKGKKTRIICTVYRPPDGDVDSLLHALENALLVYDLSNNEIWIVGDFNIDYLN